MAIRWRKKDEELLSRTVKNFNAKIRYWEGKGATYLPDTISKADIKSQIKTRQDFNRLINKYQRFSRRGAEKAKKIGSGFDVSQWELNELYISRRTTNQMATRHRKEASKILGVKNLDYTPGFNPKRAHYLQLDLRNPQTRARPEKEARNLAEFRDMARSIERKSMYTIDKRSTTYKENLKKSLDEVFGDDADFIAEHIDRMSNSELQRLHLTNQRASISNVYLMKYASGEYEAKLRRVAEDFGLSESEIIEGLGISENKQNARGKRE